MVEVGVLVVALFVRVVLVVLLRMATPVMKVLAVPLVALAERLLVVVPAPSVQLASPALPVLLALTVQGWRLHCEVPAERAQAPHTVVFTPVGAGAVAGVVDVVS